MQTSGFDPNYCQSTAYYGHPAVIDNGTIKLHHSGSEMETFGGCSSYANPGSVGYSARDIPPAYSEPTAHNSSLVPNYVTCANTTHPYYKLSANKTSDFGNLYSHNDLTFPRPIFDSLITDREPEISYNFAHHHKASISENNSLQQSPSLPLETGSESQLKPDTIKLETFDFPQTGLIKADHSVKSESETECENKQCGVSIKSSPAEEPSKQDSDLAQSDDKPSDAKPTQSYIALIATSILEAAQRRLSLGSIYGWIEKNYPYFKGKGQGWRNSVRHNLSLNDCFIKAGRCEDGKGNYWAIHPANVQDFMRGDFRQRRRSRRKGRKKDCELGMYPQITNGYLPGPPPHPTPGPAGFASGFGAAATTLSSIYSPYTDAERRAYRLDEALFRQSMGNPFMKWYPNPTPGGYATGNAACSSPMYGTASPHQWQNYASVSGVDSAGPQGGYQISPGSFQR